jgi:hypothetical protein
MLEIEHSYYKDCYREQRSVNSGVNSLFYPISQVDCIINAPDRQKLDHLCFSCVILQSHAMMQLEMSSIVLPPKRSLSSEPVAEKVGTNRRQCFKPLPIPRPASSGFQPCSRMSRGFQSLMTCSALSLGKATFTTTS